MQQDTNETQVCIRALAIIALGSSLGCTGMVLGDSADLPAPGSATTSLSVESATPDDSCARAGQTRPPGSLTCPPAADSLVAAEPPVAAPSVAAAPAAAAPAPAVTPAPAGMTVGTNFWNLGWGIWDDVFAAGVDFATTSNPWKPSFLDEVKNYAAMRFMDFGYVNDSAEQHWADRTPRNALPMRQTRLAYEWMIDLCNRTGRDMWVTVPHLADADYSYQLATLIKSNLDPGRKVYVEWSNETWNGGFAQTHYAYDRGNALGLDADPWAAAFKYHVYAAVRVFAEFERVFGAGSPRLVKVLAGQSPNTWITGIHLAALADPRINPDHLTANAYAIAPYFGLGVDGSAPDAVTRLREAMTSVVEEVKKQKQAVSAAGLDLLAYEGGQHVLQGAEVVNDKPEMYQLYGEYLDAVAPYFKLFMHYVHNGQWTSGGAWGAEKFVGQALTGAPKLRAIFDWIKKHSPG